MTKTIFISLLLAASVAQAFGRDGRIPEELRSQLSEDQISALEDASSREARRDLLESWGIKMPPPPRGKDHRRGPPPDLDEATQARVDELKAKYESATTEDEKAVLRKQIRELFREHPPRVRPDGDSGKVSQMQ